MVLWPSTQQTISFCDQLVVGPTYSRGGALDLLMTDVLDLVRVAFVEPLGNLNQFSLSDGHFDSSGVANMCE